CTIRNLECRIWNACTNSTFQIPDSKFRNTLLTDSRTEPADEHGNAFRPPSPYSGLVPSCRRSAAPGLSPPLVGARTAEEVLDRVVALVALDAEQRGVDRPERPLGGPRRRPGVRI